MQCVVSKIMKPDVSKPSWEGYSMRCLGLSGVFTRSFNAAFTLYFTMEIRCVWQAQSTKQITGKCNNSTGWKLCFKMAVKSSLREKQMNFQRNIIRKEVSIYTAPEFLLRINNNYRWFTNNSCVNSEGDVVHSMTSGLWNDLSRHDKAF